MLKFPSSIIVREPLTTIPPQLLRGVGQVIVAHARLELYLTELVYDLLRIDYPLCRQILNWQKEELRGLLHCVDAQAAACDPRAGSKSASHRPVKRRP